MLLGFYLATSLNDRVHYQVLKSEVEIIEAIENYCHPKKKKKPEIIRIGAGKNHHDDNILVIQTPTSEQESLLLEYNCSYTVNHLLNHGKFDVGRGNTFVDTGYASAKCQKRDPDSACVSQPSTLSLTEELPFLDSMVHLSKVADYFCDEYKIDRLFRVEGIAEEWAQKLHPDNLLQASRSSLSFASSGFGPHVDMQNDKRKFMSGVPVIHRIVDTPLGPARFARIGYSRRACYEAGRRRKILEPIVREVSDWYKKLQETRRMVIHTLFHVSIGNGIHREWCGLIIPVHCCKTVSLSPFIDGLLRLQSSFGFSRQHAVAVAYNVLTSERPFFFWSVTKDYISLVEAEREAVKVQSPVDLGVQFWQKMREKALDQRFKNLPSRHQPHSGALPCIEAIRQSVVNLIKLTDAIAAVPEAHREKEFYHSKSVSILSGSTERGGCYGAGMLTGQSLMHVLACLGLIPFGLAYWGEVAVTPDFLEQRGITKENTKADQFLATLSANLEVSFADAEHIICKYGRHLSKSSDRFRDAIYDGQRVFSISDGHLVVHDGVTEKRMKAPGPGWPTFVEVPFVDPDYWLMRTKTRVRGHQRIPKSLKQKMVELPTIEQLDDALPGWAEVHFTSNRYPLHVSVNNLLGHATDGTPLPWKNLTPRYKPIVTDNVLKVNWQFAYKTRAGSKRCPPLGNNLYQCQIECKLDGVIRFVALSKPEVLSKCVFRLIESKQGMAQRDERLMKGEDDYECGTKRRRSGSIKQTLGYYILHHVERGSTQPPRKIAIVLSLDPDHALVVCLNDNYYTNNKDSFLLRRP